MENLKKICRPCLLKNQLPFPLSILTFEAMPPFHGYAVRSLASQSIRVWRL